MAVDGHFKWQSFWFYFNVNVFYRAKLNGRVRESFKRPNKDMSSINLQPTREQRERMALTLKKPLWLCTCACACVCEKRKGELGKGRGAPKPLNTRGRERRVRHKWVIVEDLGNALSHSGEAMNQEQGWGQVEHRGSAGVLSGL